MPGLSARPLLLYYGQTGPGIVHMAEKAGLWQGTEHKYSQTVKKCGTEKNTGLCTEHKKEDQPCPAAP